MVAGRRVSVLNLSCAVRLQMEETDPGPCEGGSRVGKIAV
jgi:hypothetical protein